MAADTRNEPTLQWAPEHAEERRVVVMSNPKNHTAMYTTAYRQVGWLGQTGTVYPLSPHDGPLDEPGGFTALWIEVGTD